LLPACNSGLWPLWSLDREALLSDTVVEKSTL
jgi:hypothetical protein